MAASHCLFEYGCYFNDHKDLLPRKEKKSQLVEKKQNMAHNFLT
jgi:hypothetical protein